MEDMNIQFIKMFDRYKMYDNCETMCMIKFYYLDVMTDKIQCPTRKFPLRKLNTRLTVLQFIMKQNLTTNHI